jgi:hypothetical protein
MSRLTKRVESSFRGKRGFKFWLTDLIYSISIMAIIVSILIPHGIKWGMTRTLSKIGAKQVTIMDVDFNAFIGRLVIYGLKFSGPDEGVMTLDRLIVDMDLLPAWKKRIRARHISVIGLTFDVNQTGNGELAVAGFPIPLMPPEKGQIASEEKNGKPWGLGVGNLDLADINVRLSMFGIKEEVSLDLAHIKDFETWNPETTGQLNVIFTFNEGLVQFLGEARPFADKPSVTMELKVSEMPLNWMEPYLSTDEAKWIVGKRPLFNLFPALKEYNIGKIDGELLSRNKLVIEYDPEAGSRILSLKSSLVLRKVELSASLASLPVNLQEEQLLIDAEVVYEDTGSVDLDNLEVTARASIEGIKIDSPGSELNILSIGYYRLSDVKIRGTGLIEAKSLDIGDIEILESDGPKGNLSDRQDNAHVLRIKEINLNNLAFRDQKEMEIDEILVSGIDSRISIDEAGHINLVEILKQIQSGSVESDKEKKADSTSTDGSGATIKIGRIQVLGDSRVQVNDRSVTPPVEISLSPLELEVTDIDSGSPDKPSSVHLTTKSDEYSSIEVTGNVLPFAPALTMDLDVSVTSLDLPVYTAYPKRNIGYLIRSGHLNADIKWKIDMGNLDSLVTLNLKKFHLEAIKESDEDEFSQKLNLPIPINTALSLLRDKQDNIELKLPIKGNLEDPEFEIKSIVYSALGKALSKSAAGYFAPLGLKLLLNIALPPGVLTLAGSVVKSASKLRFDPVQFDPLENQLTDEHVKYLDQMAQLILDRPAIELIVCGVATSADLETFRAAVEEESSVTDIAQNSGEQAPAAALGGNMGIDPERTAPASEIQEDTPVTDEEREALQDMARKRAVAVKDFLISRGVEAGKLIVCFAELEDKADAVPRVEITL